MNNIVTYIARGIMLTKLVSLLRQTEQLLSITSIHVDFLMALLAKSRAEVNFKRKIH